MQFQWTMMFLLKLNQGFNGTFFRIWPPPPPTIIPQKVCAIWMVSSPLRNKSSRHMNPVLSNPVSFQWLTSHQKQKGLTLRPSFLNKTRHINDAISAGPKLDFLLHAITTHPPAIKARQTTIITKLGLLPLPQWFLRLSGSQY